jgi:hypothetical protein
LIYFLSIPKPATISGPWRAVDHVSEDGLVRLKRAVVFDRAGNGVARVVPVEPADQIERGIDRQANASASDDAGVDDGGLPPIRRAYR